MQENLRIESENRGRRGSEEARAYGVDREDGENCWSRTGGMKRVREREME